MDFAEPALLALLGAIVGSFMATAAVRWPDGLSVATGRSRCDGCGRTLRPAELVPILSAGRLGGRCATCGARIDPVHRVVELGGLAVGLAAGLAADGVVAWLGALFGWLLLLLAVLDLRAFWLPDRVVAPLAAAGVASAWIAGPTMVDRLIGGVAGYAGLWLVAAGYRLWRGREGLGGGDPKLLGAIGLWIGWRPLPAVLTAAALIGLAAVAATALLGRRVHRHTAVPFGALLAAAAYPAWLLMIGSAP